MCSVFVIVLEISIEEIRYRQATFSMFVYQFLNILKIFHALFLFRVYRNVQFIQIFQVIISIFTVSNSHCNIGAQNAIRQSSSITLSFKMTPIINTAPDKSTTTPMLNLRNRFLNPASHVKFSLWHTRIPSFNGFLSASTVYQFFSFSFRSVYKELHADHETGAADNK